MERIFTYSYRLDCAIRAVDTTTGVVLPSETLRVFSNGCELRPMRKPDGYLVFLCDGERLADAEVRAEGYESGYYHREADVPEGPMVLEMQMIPKLNLWNEGLYRTIEERRAGAVSIDAVSLSDIDCLVRAFDKRKKSLSVYNPHRLALDSVFYAIVDPDNFCYEAVEITEMLPNGELLLGGPLQKPFASHFSLARRVFGRVEPNGACLLRLNRATGGPRWIVRTMTDTGEQFEVVDFSAAESSGREPLG